MSVITSISSAATTLAAGLDSLANISNKTVGLVKAVSDGLAAVRKQDVLTAKLSAGSTVARATAAKTTATRTTSAAKTTAAKTTAARTTTAAKTTAAKTSTTARTTTASTGYASSASDAFAFLKDATLSVEEKLFRFMCAVAKRNDDEVLKKMEQMKGGAAAGTGTSSTAKKPASTSVWSALKALVPPLGLAAQLVGDTKLKSMITQVSGPVLAAAATALGMPALAPLALKAGPELASAVMSGKLGGAEVAAAVVGGASSGSAGASGSTASATAATGQNEQVQMMELQRLVDKQKEMFAMISNVLRAQHDTRMSIIGNVR